MSPRDLRSFTNHAKLFFLLKKITDGNERILWLGMGLSLIPELESWYLSNQEGHLAKSYDNFLADLYKRALPADFVWETEGRIRSSKQGARDYEEWSQGLRADHLLLTDKMMSTREFIKCLLYGMDPELSSILRRGDSLKGSGFHEDDQAAQFLAETAKLTPTTTTTATTVTTSTATDYEAFDREARDEWARIARRKEANAAQIREATKKQQRASSSTTSSAPAPHSSTTASSQPQAGSRTRLGKLTSLEKDWLRANKGCFHCRKIEAGHEGTDCTVWPAPGFKIEIPAGWKAGDPVPKVEGKATSNSSTRITVEAIHADVEVDLPESLADDSDTESDA